MYNMLSRAGILARADADERVGSRLVTSLSLSFSLLAPPCAMRALGQDIQKAGQTCLLPNLLGLMRGVL